MTNPCSLKPRSIPDLQWWVAFLASPQPRKLLLLPLCKVILSDASDNGWGAVVTDTTLAAGGLFTGPELYCILMLRN